MNFSKCFCRCSAVLAVGLVFFNAQADIAAQEQGNSIVIEREGRRANPTIRFQGINGDPALNTQIDSDLRHCGWFDVRKGGNETTDYVLSGSDNGNTLTLSPFQRCRQKDRRSPDHGAGQTQTLRQRGGCRIEKRIFRSGHLQFQSHFFCGNRSEKTGNLYV